MIFSDYLNKKNMLIAGAIAILSMFALWLRLLPMLTMGNTDILSMVASDDPLYNLRQVEHLIVNFPNYARFDPLVFYPTGIQLYWGSLFPTIVAVCCILFGATTRTEIISVGLLVPPVMGALIVSVMYFIGRTCGDWKTGLISAGFSAVVTGQYFYRSMYGYMDHHIAEVMFSTIFCLLYMYTLSSVNGSKINLKDIHTYKRIIWLSALTGIAYLLGLFVMPTMILFAMIVVMFTSVMFIANMIRGKNSEYLLVTNTVIYVVASIGILLYGVQFNTIDLSTYSIGHVYSYACVIVITGALYLLAQFTLDHKRTWMYYTGMLTALTAVGVGVLYLVSTQLYTLFVSSFFAFFGQAAITTTVQEARAWTNADAWNTFGYGILLMLGGVIVSIYKNIKENHPHMIFVLVWSVVMLYSTYQHVRYEYYLAINVAILSAICVGFIIETSMKDINNLTKLITTDAETFEPVTKEKPLKKHRKSDKKSSITKGINYILLSTLAISLILSGMFAVGSCTASYNNAINGQMKMNPDWKETLEWMYKNTPEEKGVNYTQIYDAKTYAAPEGTYGVMSWWDYGHMILYIAHRAPNANPFQQGITGETGSATFFMSTDESVANKVLDLDKTRYVITDTEMDTGKFWAMATWYNSTLSVTPYQYYMLAPTQNNPGNYNPALINTDKYYLTMISRLHNFDGSMTTPTTVIYVEYVDTTLSGSTLPTLTTALLLPVNDATNMASNYNLNAVAGHHATVTNTDPTKPTVPISALQHYRLIHESPTTTITSDNTTVKYVKTFEYVKGAHIKGEGIIEVPIITNTGRTFIYRQASINGEFIVPYATTSNNYDVKTLAKYKIVGSNKEYDVSDESVMGV